MHHEIKDNVYYIYDDDNKVLLSIELTEKPGDQIIIETKKDKYSGPISLIFD